MGSKFVDLMRCFETLQDVIDENIIRPLNQLLRLLCFVLNLSFGPNFCNYYNGPFRHDLQTGEPQFMISDF